LPVAQNAKKNAFYKKTETAYRLSIPFFDIAKSPLTYQQNPPRRNDDFRKFVIESTGTPIILVEFFSQDFRQKR
jgi:hypothetical protein